MLDVRHVLARWAVRAWWTVAAFGLWTTSGAPRNVPNTQGVGYTDVDARNYAAGRPSVLDRVTTMTEEHQLVPSTRLAADVWATLETLDSQGTVALAAVRRDQADRFVAEGYARNTARAAENEQARAERRRRRLGQACAAAAIVFDLDGKGQNQRDAEQRRMTREIYIQNNQRR